MNPADAFRDALEHEMGRGSDFRDALRFFGGTRNMADELGVSQRTVQRWAAYEAGGGAQSRNPMNSPHASDIKAAAESEREERALQRLEEMDSFDSDEVDVDYEGEDEGTRHAQTMAGPLDLAATIAAYRAGAQPADVGAAFAAALGASYGLPEGIHITNISGLTLQ